MSIYNMDVQFVSNGFKLVGTLALTEGDGPFPAILLIPGSGPVDRDENIKGLPINVTGEIAVHLAGIGVGSFRYDKRGVGASEGDFLRTGFYDNVIDAMAAFQTLYERPEIDSSRLFVLGHSEGAVITTKMAGDHVAGAGAVLLSCPAQPGEAILRWQSARATENLTG